MNPDDLRARRRAIAKRHHPDLGGDPAEFDRAMRALDGPQVGSPVGSAPVPGPGAPHDIVITPSARTRLRRGVAATRETVTTHVASHVAVQVQRLARLTRRAP